MHYLCSNGALLMPVPCEIAVKSVIPAVRAYVAKELTQTHKMKQNDVAELLGVTQTAVSKYIGKVRGQAIKIDQTEELRNMMNDIALKIADGEISGPQLTLRFCQVCATVRVRGLMCMLCRRSDPKPDIVKCNVCRNGQSCAVNI